MPDIAEGQDHGIGGDVVIQGGMGGAGSSWNIPPPTIHFKSNARPLRRLWNLIRVPFTYLFFGRVEL